jgi:uncharacterized protein GlcG (DUF336 family)
MRFSLIAASLCVASAMSTFAHAQESQPLTPHYSLPLDVAIDAAKEAIRVCEAKHYWVTATVVDMDGIPQVVLRGDQATVHTGESSFRKAFTVVTLGPEFSFDRSSGFFELMKTSPFAPQLATVHNVMALPGAVAFKVNGEMVGALGIGGAPGGDKDEVCAAAGVAKVSERLRTK